MKKIIYALVLMVFLISCNEEKKIKSEETEGVKRAILAELPNQIEKAKNKFPIEYKKDNFYFIYGLDYNKNKATDIRYRGIIYSDKLKEYGYPGGIEIGLRELSASPAEIYSMAGNYLALLMQIEIDSIAENRAREIFGQKINLSNDGTTTKYMYNAIVENFEYDLPPEEKVGYYSTIVNLFVDDLDKLDNEEIKEKTFELAKFIYEKMNYRSALQVYVRDDKYFKDYDLVYGSIYKPFRTREDIVKILKKIKNKETIKEEEKISLVRVFRKGGLDYENCLVKVYDIRFKDKEEFPIDIKKVIFEGILKNGRYGDE